MSASVLRVIAHVIPESVTVLFIRNDSVYVIVLKCDCFLEVVHSVIANYTYYRS